MAKVVGVQIYEWEDIKHFADGGLDLKFGDKVVVHTDVGIEVGNVRYVDKEIPDKDLPDPLPAVLRKVNAEDQEKIDRYAEKGIEALAECRELVRKYNLEMKLVNAYFSFDGSRIMITFTAEARVDFRSLVRDLTRRFQKSIRLQQIGSRDDAKVKGALGMCGQEVCCKRFLTDFTSITTDLARVQQMNHRGSDRISGVCGRLMCCLAYEAEQYQEWLKTMPGLGSNVRTKQGKGRVIDRNLPKQTVRVLLHDKKNTEETMIDVSVKDLKKNVL